MIFMKLDQISEIEKLIVEIKKESSTTEILSKAQGQESMITFFIGSNQPSIRLDKAQTEWICLKLLAMSKQRLEKMAIEFSKLK